MGSALSKRFNNFLQRKNVRLLMLGLDNAGKTTIMYQLHIAPIVVTIPTIGFMVETVKYRNFRFTIWDIGGERNIQPIWYDYFKDASALIFVVDSADRSRLLEVKRELHQMMGYEELQNAVLLVYANKQDILGSVKTFDLAVRLDLHYLNQEWHIQPCCAITGNGLFEGLEVLREMLKTNLKKKK